MLTMGEQGNRVDREARADESRREKTRARTVEMDNGDGDPKFSARGREAFDGDEQSQRATKDVSWLYADVDGGGRWRYKGMWRRKWRQGKPPHAG